MGCLDLEGWGWGGSPIAPPPGGREWASQVQAGFTWHYGRILPIQPGSTGVWSALSAQHSLL